MRYIFMDEAGTSAKEPVTVVVGLIANADEHVMAAEALALEAVGSVPPHLKERFVFHAAQVFGDQVADACAYGFRRYFSKEKFGPEFVAEILGSADLASHFSSPSGTECWWFHGGIGF